MHIDDDIEQYDKAPANNKILEPDTILLHTSSDLLDEQRESLGRQISELEDKILIQNSNIINLKRLNSY